MLKWFKIFSAIKNFIKELEMKNEFLNLRKIVCMKLINLFKYYKVCSPSIICPRKSLKIFM